MPLVRLIIFLFRGIGRIFSAIGRFLKALVGAGMRSFILKSFEAALRLSLIGSLIAAAVVCYKLFGEKPYVSGGYESIGPPYTYEFDRYNGYGYRGADLDFLLTRFVPKDPKVDYGPGKLDVQGLIRVWKTCEMVHVAGENVRWTSVVQPPRSESAKPVLEEEDFMPRRWGGFTSFFEQTWAIMTLPLLLAWLVFPAGSGIVDRVHRTCLVAPLCVIVSCSLAYLLTRHWLAVQHEAAAQLVLDLPRWVHPVGVLNNSILAGVAFSLIPVVLWYLLRWVLGPFLNPSSVVRNP